MEIKDIENNDVIEADETPQTETGQTGEPFYYCRVDEYNNIVGLIRNTNVTDADPDVWFELRDVVLGEKPVQYDEDGNETEYDDGKLYLPKLLDGNNIPMYKLIDGEIIERSEEERAADIPEIPPAPPSAALQIEALNNTAHSMYESLYGEMFDGLKYIANRDKPIPVRFPMDVMQNLIYTNNNADYVCVKNGIVTEDNFCEFLEAAERECCYV